MSLLALLPALLIIGALFLYPLLLTLRLSLAVNESDLGWTGEHYRALLMEPDRWRSLVMTLLVSALATAIIGAISIVLAWCIRRRVTGYRLLQGLALLPLVVPHLIAALGLLLFMDTRGWGNHLLSALLGGVQIKINYTFAGLLLSYVWVYLPYTALLAIGSFAAIAPAVDDAAQACGASEGLILRRVLLPQALPDIIAGSILTYIQCFGAFSIPLITGGGDYRPIAVQIYTLATVFHDWSPASALAIVMALVQVALLVLYMRMTRRQAR